MLSYREVREAHVEDTLADVIASGCKVSPEASYKIFKRDVRLNHNRLV